MYLLRIQVNQLVEVLIKNGIDVTDFTHQNGNDDYSIRHRKSDCYITLRSINAKGAEFAVNYGPDLSSLNAPKKRANAALTNWNEVVAFFGRWASWAKAEIDAPNLWAEAAKAAQLFTPTSTPTDDKFTRTELAEVQGQLRLLQQSFATAALPEAARQKLIELTQTAAVKAEGLTKKDWQNWLIGGFISAIASCALNPTQAAEVLKLVKAAFGGLFLH